MLLQQVRKKHILMVLLMLAEIDKEELLKVFTGEKRKDEDDTTLKPSTKKVMTQPALQKLFLAVCFFTLVHVFQ